VLAMGRSTSVGAKRARVRTRTDEAGGDEDGWWWRW